MISHSDEERMLLLLEEHRKWGLFEEEAEELIQLLSKAYKEQRKQLAMMRG